MRAAGDFALLRVRLTPKVVRTSSQTSRRHTVVRVAAPPVDERNRALEELQAKRLHIARSRISLASGHTSRDKTVRIDGLTPEELNARLERDAERKHGALMLRRQSIAVLNTTFDTGQDLSTRGS